MQGLTAELLNHVGSVGSVAGGAHNSPTWTRTAVEWRLRCPPSAIR